MIVAVPVDDGVKVTEHDDVWPEPAISVHVAVLNVPDAVPLALKLTVPDGAAVVRLETPTTVAVQVES